MRLEKGAHRAGDRLVHREYEEVVHAFLDRPREGRGHGRAGRGLEHQAAGIGLAPDAERVNLERGLAGRDGRADLEHVGPEDLLTGGMQVVSVILHEGSAARKAPRHHFHGSQESGGFPIPFRSEAVAEAIGLMIRENIGDNLIKKLGYFMMRPVFRALKRRVDYAEYGGMPLIGINGISIISHGRSSAQAIKNAIRVAAELAKSEAIRHMHEDIEKNMELTRAK